MPKKKKMDINGEEYYVFNFQRSEVCFISFTQELLSLFFLQNQSHHFAAKVELTSRSLSLFYVSNSFPSLSCTQSKKKASRQRHSRQMEEAEEAEARDRAFTAVAASYPCGPRFPV